jgi:hypothetical protein
VSLIRQHTGHEWRPCAPREPTPAQREPSAQYVWPWKCTACGAYAETALSPLLTPRDVSPGRIPLPGPTELERWGAAPDCETEAVEKVHAL